MNSRARSLVAAALAAALAAGALVWSNAAPSAPLAGIATAAVLRGDIEDVVTALGTLQPQEFVDVGTQVSGQLKRLAVAVGDTVKPGTLLAEIDTAVLAAWRPTARWCRGWKRRSRRSRRSSCSRSASTSATRRCSTRPW